ncbi:hypothetical protein SKAU_G00085380 [Synaphobranchus kaupii]|uniref:Methyltransferase type 11 domain-containing protein n=1 Tax=Synaphobranchus kaupii TaxID=118154 RepID=A0A9Q1FVM5_SYNKA|nr:hypothetical protein SKAU_G00085380 [Synaphobranchus kaupii]
MEEAASQLERDHVHSVYEKIAPYFNDSRYKAWPKVRQFLLDQEPGSIVADVGCGNGKYLDINDDVFKLGCDVCSPLVDTARSRGYEVQVCDGLRLPYRRGCFDAVLSIAVIHHLSTKERRIRAIKEMARTLRVGGRLMVYVWAMEQKRRKFEKQDVFIPWNPNPPSSPASSRRRGGSSNDSDGGDKHRKVKSTSSMADEDEDPAGAKDQRSPKDQRWFFSRSLDSVLDFGCLATPKPPARELNVSCAQMGEVGGPKACRRARGVALIRQFSSIFSSSANGSEEDVFGSTADLGGTRERSDGRPAGEREAVFGAIISGCSSVPLPDLVTHQRERLDGTGQDEGDVESQGTPPQRQASSESLQDRQVNRWGKEKPADPCLRYYHVFREGELLELIQNHVEELHVLQSYLDHSNWCVVAEKVQVWKI